MTLYTEFQSQIAQASYLTDGHLVVNMSMCNSYIYSFIDTYTILHIYFYRKYV